MKSIKGLFFRDFKNAYFPEILKELYRDRIYAPYVEDKTDLVVLDVGSNVGLFSHYIYPYARKVYAVEPAKEHADVIRYMLKHNKMDDKVEVVQAAVGRDDGKAYFYHSENTTMFSLKPEVNNTGIKEEVEVITIKTLVERTKEKTIDFMKLDVEGSEMDVIGGKWFKMVSPKIKRIVGEYHTWSGIHPHQIEAVLRDTGYQFEWLGKTEATIFHAWQT